MSAKNPINKAASIRQKLLNHSKANGQDFQRTIDAYAMECILDRLAHSEYTDRFLLKGALLFAVWQGLGKRPTRDIDLMGRGTNDITSIIQIFKNIVSVDIVDDCVIFAPDRIEGLRIKMERISQKKRTYCRRTFRSNFIDTIICSNDVRGAVVTLRVKKDINRSHPAQEKTKGT